jgi:DNA-binding SARP family transcriptional activator
MCHNRPGGRRLNDKGLEIRLLGDIAVIRGGRALLLPASKKTRALLGYLVATGTPHLRERLCELLWDGPDDPRAALRWSLSKLRPLVDQANLVADRERIGFAGGGVEIDLHALRAALVAGEAPLDELRRVAERSTGELLDGLDLPDCFRFHAWWTAEREAVRSERIKLFAQLSLRLADDAPEEALKWARARLAADPLSDAAHAAVVRCLGALGRTRDAAAHYDDARRQLAAELGGRPLPELTRARDELAHRAAPAIAASVGEVVLPPAATRTSRATAMPSVTPLVGRARERAQLSALVEVAAAGQSRELALIVGEPGIGKSRLLDELAVAMRAAGGLVLGGRAFEAEMVRPYGAWVDALRALDVGEIPLRLRTELAPLLPELGAAPTTSERVRLYDAVVTLLSSLARAGRPLALVLDDVHWLDESSAALLHYVARAQTGGHLVIAAAARPGELADQRAVLQVVRALGRDGRVRRIELGPLDAAAIAELVGSDDAARVFADSGGNPLFALELAAAGADGGGDTLDELLRDRLDRLGGRARDLLPFTAALGRSFGVELLAAAAALPPADLVAAVDDLERCGILRAGAAGSYDFAHDLVRAAAYRQMSEPRRRLVHQQIAAALGRAPDPDGALAGDRAHHAAVAGDFVTAARACLAAGERCLRVFAQAEGDKMSARGLSYLDRVPDEVRLELEIPLYRVAVYADNARAATRELETQISRAVLQAEAAGKRNVAQEGFHVLAMLQWRADALSRAQDWTLLSAEKARTADPATAARGLATTSRCLTMINRDMPRAVAMALEADALARAHHLEIPEVPWALGMAYHFSGDVDRALATHEQALVLNRRAQDHWGECMCLLDMATIELEERRFAALRARLRLVAPVAAKLGAGSEAPFADALAALVAYGLDEPDAAAGLARALAALRDLDAKSLYAYAHNAAAEIDLAAGRDAAAGAHTDAARAAAAAVDRPSEVALADALAARAAAAAGDEAAARRFADALAAVDPTILSARARRHVGAALAHRRSRP